jgi:hypothetical protein
MKLFRIAAFAILATFLALPASGQPGPGAGSGQSATGKGPGFRFNKDNTYGWSLMTPEERNAHRQKMLSAKTYDECKGAQTEHHASMEARAKSKVVTLAPPRQNVCDRMKARGMVK